MYKIKNSIIAIISTSVFFACGVKGPPVVPGYIEPPTVRDLSYQVSGDKLVLSWTLPTAVGRQVAKIASAGVYRLKRPMGKRDCPDCPQVFERVAKLAARSGTMTYTDTVSPGFQYYYKIILFDTSDRSGGDSNIVYFIHEGNSQ
jgi:hypothetical protein